MALAWELQQDEISRSQRMGEGSQGATASDAALARELQRREREESQRALSIIGRDERGERDVRPALATRAWFLLFCLMDVMGLVTLLMQVSPPGLPLDGNAMYTRLTNGSLLESIWFAPLVAACLTPVFGGVFGAFMLRAWSLWVYCAHAIVFVVVRVVLCFAWAGEEGRGENPNLLTNLTVSTAFLFVQLSACQLASRMGLHLMLIKAGQMTASQAVRLTARSPATIGASSPSAADRQPAAQRCTNRPSRLAPSPVWTRRGSRPRRAGAASTASTAPTADGVPVEVGERELELVPQGLRLERT